MRRRHRQLFMKLLIAINLGVFIGMLILYGQIQQALGSGSGNSPNQLPVTDLVFEATPGPDVLTLQAIVGDAPTDAVALQRVVDYYNAEKDRLSILWREENETRLAGLFTMYVIHISHIYGETPNQTSFLDYLTLERSHCGNYSVAQAEIAQALGLEWQLLELSSGWHGWLEVMVDGQWEIFDSTVNVWINKSSDQLVQGAERQYRSFYTPLLDIDRPDARLHLNEGYNMQALRVNMPGFGLFYNPPGEIGVSHRLDEIFAANE